MKHTIRERLAAFEDHAGNASAARRFNAERRARVSQLRNNGGSASDWNHIPAAAETPKRGSVDAYLAGVRARALTDQEVANIVAGDAYYGKRRLIRRTIGAVAATAAAVGLYFSPQIARGIDEFKVDVGITHIQDNPHPHELGMEQPVMATQYQPSSSEQSRLPQHRGPEGQ